MFEYLSEILKEAWGYSARMVVDDLKARGVGRNMVNHPTSNTPRTIRLEKNG